MSCWSSVLLSLSGLYFLALGSFCLQSLLPKKLPAALVLVLLQAGCSVQGERCRVVKQMQHAARSS